MMGMDARMHQDSRRNEEAKAEMGLYNTQALITQKPALNFKSRGPWNRRATPGNAWTLHIFSSCGSIFLLGSGLATPHVKSAQKPTCEANTPQIQSMLFLLLMRRSLHEPILTHRMSQNYPAQAEDGFQGRG